MSDPEEQAWLEAYKNNEPPYVPPKDVYLEAIPAVNQGENKTITLEEEILIDPTMWS